MLCHAQPHCCPLLTHTPLTNQLRCSLNERGLFDYLLLNDDLEATAAELERIAEVSCKVEGY